ncbi:Cleavage and polyadenylation specificity factor [Giardia muris]|uniref:Cleavage and polyadenylation specificity factor n=1 Tax=Giardia muris TaxID=5742 RepID=A0A4Z1SRV7_GIAMU|nr:Cleavage and polyadenylation specificity factor [Giardia muris]TNJ28649.1 Cleavage and polyadenylation specificity factor [Giardia muris]|eukprot:TNJ28642.1 Cleavage and polyadenylation specificity factor [Giardia muris]
MVPKDSIIFTPLGAGEEVGRSCFLLSFQRRGKRGQIMLDCGLHPGLSEQKDGCAQQALPFFDVQNLNLSLILVTHFHNDHIAALPYFVKCLRQRARAENLPEDKYIPPIYMTSPTLTIFQSNATDIGTQTRLYDEKDVSYLSSKVTPLSSFYETKTVNSITFTVLPAGHVIGAAMFLINIDGYQILYTGDFSCEPEDRHLHPAAFKALPTRLDMLIIEATYGSMTHTPRSIRETEFISEIVDTLKKEGRVLLPVFTIGRVQELLLILSEHWQKHPDLKHFPIYYISSSAKSAENLYVEDVGFLRDRHQQSHAFVKRTTSERSIGPRPCVVFCTPAMLQAGASRALFEEWCSRDSNLLLVTGYATPGTLLYRLLEENPPERIMTSAGLATERRIRIKNISFSAHSDFAQTSSVIQEMNPRDVVFIHGSYKSMESMRKGILTQFPDSLTIPEGTPVPEVDDHRVRFHYPANGQSIVFPFTRPVIVGLSLEKQAQLTENSIQRLYLSQNGFSCTAYDLKGFQAAHRGRLNSLKLTLKVTCMFTAEELQVLLSGHEYTVALEEDRIRVNCQQAVVDLILADRQIMTTFELYSAEACLHLRILLLILNTPASTLKKYSVEKILDKVGRAFGFSFVGDMLTIGQETLHIDTQQWEFITIPPGLPYLVRQRLRDTCDCARALASSWFSDHIPA